MTGGNNAPVFTPSINRGHMLGATDNIKQGQSMNDERVLQAMRQQAWERAKGELNAVLCALYDNLERFAEFDRLTKEYIKRVEDYGLSE